MSIGCQQAAQLLFGLRAEGQRLYPFLLLIQLKICQLVKELRSSIPGFLRGSHDSQPPNGIEPIEAKENPHLVQNPLPLSSSASGYRHAHEIFVAADQYMPASRQPFRSRTNRHRERDNQTVPIYPRLFTRQKLEHLRYPQAA